MSRKPYYKDKEREYLLARKLREEGKSYREIESHIKIPIGTFRNWIKDIKVNKTKILSDAIIKVYDGLGRKSQKGIRANLIRVRGNQCQGECSLKEWFGKPITLELEHIDGNKKNNEEHNLLLLCPNCHSYTVTWRRKKSQARGQTR